MGETVAWIGCGVMWFGMDGPSHSPRTFQYRISEQASEPCNVRGGDGEAQQLSQCLEEVEAVDVRHRALDNGADLRFDVFLVVVFDWCGVCQMLNSSPAAVFRQNQPRRPMYRRDRRGHGAGRQLRTNDARTRARTHACMGTDLLIDDEGGEGRHHHQPEHQRQHRAPPDPVTLFYVCFGGVVSCVWMSSCGGVMDG